MSLKLNGKVITKNRYISSVLLSLVIMVFPLIPIGAITILGEIVAKYQIMGLVSGVYLESFVEMWMGGVLSLMGLMVAFGRKNSSLIIGELNEK